MALKVCQSPSRRGTHFYIFGDYYNPDSNLVSIPFTSGNSFLLSWLVASPDGRSVSIPFTSGNSFLPSPLFFVEFMRVSSLDFRGIFQIILKTAVFSVASIFLSIFYKRAEFERHAFLQILVFCLSRQSHFKPTALYRPHRMTAVQTS